uniref:Uncharacterized protein n=1 Tax=Anguilla anguilla TaxID=7936 RepID=A0A0E9VH09_ANGAN
MVQAFVKDVIICYRPLVNWQATCIKTVVLKCIILRLRTVFTCSYYDRFISSSC